MAQLTSGRTSDPRHERLMEMAAEVVQLERQLRLLIEAADAYLNGSWQNSLKLGETLEDRLETAKALLS
jgi:hypothetical protein